MSRVIIIYGRETVSTIHNEKERGPVKLREETGGEKKVSFFDLIISKAARNPAVSSSTGKASGIF